MGKNIVTGKDIAGGMNAADQTEVLLVIKEVILNFTEAFQAFNATGPVGSRLTATAPVIVLDPTVALPNLQSLGPAEMAASKMQLLYALLDPEFTDSLGLFQTRFATSTLAEQAVILRSFVAIDWEFLVAPDLSTNILERLQRGFYSRRQKGEIKKSELEQISVLVKVPQFVQLLRLAGAYGKMMLAAHASFENERQFLEKGASDNEKIVAELDAILAEFQKTEELRLQTIASIQDTTVKLQKAIELAQVLADLDNRSGEMQIRVGLDKELAGYMRVNSEQTVRSQLAMLGELQRSLHLLASNQSRESRVAKAVVSLNLYVKCYTIFELILTMLQVYLLAASSAVQTVLANRIQAVGAKFGREYYLQNVQPLRDLSRGYIANFEEPLPLVTEGK